MVFIGWNSTWQFNRIQLVDGDMKYPQRIDVGIVMAFLIFRLYRNLNRKVITVVGYFG